MSYEKEDINFRVYKGFNIVSERPHYFWTVRTFDNKDIPELKESFTMVSLATKAIDAYLTKVGEKKKKK